MKPSKLNTSLTMAVQFGLSLLLRIAAITT